MSTAFSPPPAGAAPESEAGTGRRRLDLLLRLSRDAGGGAVDRIRPRAEGGPAPLSFGQERLWVLHQLDPASAAYNISGAFRLPPVDAPALERALGEVVRRHEVLRSVFREMDGTATQEAVPFDGFALPADDLSSLDDVAREAEMRRLAAEEAARPFDLSTGPLFRARLLRLGAEDVLLLALHHAVADGWSIGVLFRELGALYGAYRQGGASPLPEPEAQYADFAAWQRERLEGETLERQLAWWRERLAGAPALLELPLDRPRPAVQSFRGARASLDLPADLRERLRALGRGEDATLFMVLLAGFGALLARHGAGDDVVVGTPVSGRGRPEVEGMIGFFVNTLVLRADLSGDPPFREAVRRAREVALGAFDHQETPFERLVADLQPERSQAHAPLFQVMFTVDAAPAAAGGAGELRAAPVETERESAQYDLSMTVSESADGLRATLAYATDLFERDTARRILARFGRLLEQAAADPDVRLSRLELLDDAERRLLLDERNRTARPYPRGVPIPDLFDAQVRARPEAEALAWGDTRLTYADLDARANRLAHHLVRRGVGPESRVGVLLERGIDLVVSILAVLKAGGCYVPLDPAYPPERLSLMLADAGVRVLLTRGDAQPEGMDFGGEMVRLDEAAHPLAAERDDAPRSDASPESLAYIVYTSGSTGRPKGVMVAHRHVVQLVRETDYVRLAPGDRVAQASNASFDALTFELFGALLNGATLVGIDRDVLLSPPALREFLRENGITTLYQTTALLNQLTREQPDVFATLREVLFGGQASDADRVRALLASGKPQRLLHVYGPTETTAWCSWEQVERVDEDALTVSVGRPTGNQRIYLLDSALQPVPIGVPGEAYVGGDGVVRGYLDRPALTAERFLPDPFAGEPGARMYRTGDRLRWRADGALEFAGRLDDQVKIRGFRIEPGEIESVLCSHPDVREARVIVREDEPGEKRLVAYVVGDADEADVWAHLRRSLPEYMVPAAFVALGHLPLTPNGKLDVRALPAPEYGAAEDRYEAPRTPVMEVLAGIWSEVLRVARVGVRDDFFALGGHSLLATRVASRVRSIFSVELPLRALFEGRTVAVLAGAVEALRRAGAPILPPVVPMERDRPLPLSFAQERLWFLHRLDPGSTTYNMHVPLRLRGPLDVAALERALGEIVRRHESLRTVFRDVDGLPAQVVAPAAGFALPVDDLSALDDAEREAELRRRVEDAARRPYDLAAGPLFRAALLRLGEEDHALLLGMHHVVSDGWSVGVLFRELSALYAAYREGADSPLPELPVQYADFAAWQRGEPAGRALERQLAYWRERLAGAPALLALPTDRPRPAVQTHRGAYEQLDLPDALPERLRALGRSGGATLYMVLLGAFQSLLTRYAGTEDVVVGTPTAGRTRRETEELIGFFVNTLVLRTDLSGDPAFRELLGRVREATLGAFEHQDVPFERLVAELQPERSLSHSAVTQVMFAVNDGAGGSAAELAGVRVEHAGAEPDTATFDLSLSLTVTPRGLVAGARYRTDLFDRATVRRMLEHLGRVLEQVADHPDAPISRLELLGEAERRMVVDEWNRTEAPYPADACVHHLFEAQAERTPDALAVICGGDRLTYRRLDEAANRLARHLAGMGVGPEVRVGLCLERGVEMVVAVLAVLKAGGAYVPLDPASPPERLSYMLADSGVAVLATQVTVRGKLPAVPGIRVVVVEEARARIEAESAAPVDGGAGPGSLAYVIYTSGSTGRPKGVGVEHRGVCNLVPALVRLFGLGPGSHSMLLAPLHFDASAAELFAALCSGAALHVPEPNRLLLGEELVTLLRRDGITHTKFTPSALAALPAGDLPALATLAVGGEACTPELVERWGRGRRFINVYGPTEATVRVCAAVCVPEPRAPSLGAPLPNTRLYVLDGGGRPAPVGVPGELYAGGVQLARGYLGRPGLTAERFVPDPFAAEPGGRLYRTGDRVRWRADGTLEFLGRNDAQVKVRGFRVEPGEVEAALRGHPDVLDCAVVAREDAPGEWRLVAYVSGWADAEALRVHLRRTLPEYMVPAVFVAMEAFPRTPSGKLDRRALPAPAPAQPARRVEPGAGLESRIAEIWAELLGVGSVGAEDNFFDLGGHSLLLARLQGRLARELGREVPLVDLFHYPTVRSLARALRGEARSGAAEQGQERGEARQAARARLAPRRPRG